MNTRISVLGLLSSVLCLTSGCKLLPAPQADPVRHFTLSGPAAEVTPAADAATVRPVQLAGHLRSRAMAVRISAHEVVYLEEVRWAEPLDEAITQMLRNRLRTVGGGAVVTVQVLRCELDRSAGDTVQLAATYTIIPPGGATRSGAFAATPRHWSGRDPGTLVGLIREAVGELGEAIAAEK